MNGTIDLKTICFLCGESMCEGDEIDKEHIFPKWVLNRYQKAGKVSFSIGQERQRQKFYSHKCMVHHACNSAFARKIETPVSNEEYSHDVLWIWCLKIVIGLRFFEYGFDLVRARPGVEKNFTFDEYPDDANSFWEFSDQLFRNGGFSNTPAFSIIEIEYLFDEPTFFYNLCHELGVMWIALGERCFVVFFRSLLGPETLDCYKRFWTTLAHEANDEDIPPQVRYNIFCARIAIENYFSGAGWSFDFSQSHNFRTPTGLERTAENEDYFYELFHLKPIRSSGEIVEWRTIPNHV